MDIQIVIKSFIGFIIVLIIQLLSKSKNYVLAALVPLFPSMAIFSYYFVSQAHGLAKLQETIVFGMISLLTYFGFLLALLFFSRHFKIIPAIFLASCVWFVCAFIQVKLWEPVKAVLFKG